MAFNKNRFASQNNHAFIANLSYQPMKPPNCISFITHRNRGRSSFPFFFTMRKKTRVTSGPFCISHNNYTANNLLLYWCFSLLDQFSSFRWSVTVSAVFLFAVSYSFLIEASDSPYACCSAFFRLSICFLVSVLMPFPPRFGFAPYICHIFFTVNL